MSKTFLSAEWKKLAMANYEVDVSVLQKYLPFKTNIDVWQDRCYVSLVGFLFTNVKLKGISIPFHTTFEEVNLRFYVRYNDKGEWKRGVVFIKEIVPKPALTFVANRIYKEHYETMSMKHQWSITEDEVSVDYQWKCEHWQSFKVIAKNYLVPINQGSEEEFITEHYWGYTKLSESKTAEYGVEHERWLVYHVTDFAIDVDFGLVYGQDFAFLNKERPVSVFLAEGSEIVVKEGKLIS